MSRHTLSKRIIAVLLSLTITVTLVPITVYAETDKVTLTAGDLDGIGGVTIMDVLILLRHIAGKTELTTEQYKAANVNGDSKVDIDDLLLMLRYVAGKINSFPNAQGEDEEDPTDEIDWDNLTDSDGDGLPDILEDYYGTDKDNPDTDRDGANDYLEILNGTDPLIYDMDLDYDNDGITNGDEILKYQTDPWNEDTDDDSLTDYEELFTYKTDPLNPDTDNDGMSDGSEIILGLDPLNPDTDRNGIIDGEEILTQPVELDSMYEFDGLSAVPSIDITGSGDLVRSLYAENIIDNTAVGELPYLVGEPFDFVHDDNLEFESSTLKFKLSDDIIAEHNIEDLVIAYYDMDEGIVSFVPTEHDGNSVWAEVEHFSPYMVVDGKKYGNAEIANYGDEAEYYDEQERRATADWKGHRYQVRWLYKWDSNWENAYNGCEKLGGHLMTIDSKAEYEFLQELAVHGELIDEVVVYWIGIKRENNQWKSYNDKPLNYKWWQGDGIPDNIQIHKNGALFIYKTHGAYQGYICEWDYIPNKFKVLLADGTYVTLNKDPELGDMTVDTDGDGIPDLQELTKKVNIPVNPNSGNDYRVAWGFKSNPAKTDSDGDGLLDGAKVTNKWGWTIPDPEPMKYNKFKPFGTQEYRHDVLQRQPKNIMALMSYGQEIAVIMEDVTNAGKSCDAVPFEYWDKLCEHFNDMVIHKKIIVGKDLHYFRNKLNRAPAMLEEMLVEKDKWTLLVQGDSLYHMFGLNGEYNLKFVSNDGKFEGVYRPKYNSSNFTEEYLKEPKNWELASEYNDVVNMGTYNYAFKPDLPRELGLNYIGNVNHWLYDMTPYNTWRNTENDVKPDETTENNDKKYESNDLAKLIRRYYEDKCK